MSLSEHLPILAILALLLTAFIVPVVAKWKNELAGPVSIAALTLSLVLTIALAGRVFSDGAFYYRLGNWSAPWGIEFYVDALGVFMMLMLTFVGLLILVYAVKDLAHELKKGVDGWYYTLYLLLLAGMMGMSVTNDLFNMFVLIEIVAISSVAIISVKDNRDCVEASFKYLVLSAVSSGAFLLGVALIYMVTGHLNIDAVAAGLETALALYPRNILVAMALIAVGLGLKAALFPLHVWLPDAHSSAVSPSSAILSGLVIKIYALVFIRVFLKVFPWEIYNNIPVMDLLLWMSTFGIIVGSLFAIVQTDIKRMLAYSSVVQIGYVFLGVALLAQTAMVGAVLHIFFHALMKAMLFLSAGAIIYSTGIRRISDLKGLGLKMPVVMTMFAIGALAMVGIPGTNGFISKLYLALGALEAGRPFFLFVIMGSSLLNAVYYFPIVGNAFFGKREEPLPEIKPIPMAMLIPVVIMGVAIVVTGVYAAPVVGLATKAVAGLLSL